jgi:hypothetical protein
MVREKKAKRPKPGSIWEDPRYRRILEEPIGTSSLSNEEIEAIIKAGFGRRPDLPSGSEYVHSLKKIWRGLVSNRG